MPDTGRLIVLTGPIGAGKTTVAAELLRQPDVPTAYVEGDAFWRFIAKSKPGPRQEAFRTILRGMSATAAAFARDGYQAWLDFSMPPDYLARATTLFRDVETHLVVLRPAVEICIERAANRKAGAIRDAQAITEFYALFTTVADRHVIADATASPAATAARIRAGLDRGEFHYA